MIGSPPSGSYRGGQKPVCRHARVNAVYEWNYVWAYWYNDDGTFLVGNVCKRGGVPHYPSEDNYKLTKWSSSYEYNYVFDGWDPAITSISANTNYTLP